MAHERGGAVAHDSEASDDLQAAGRRVGPGKRMSTNARADEKDSASGDAPYFKNKANGTVHKAFGDARNGVPQCLCPSIDDHEPVSDAPAGERCGRCWGGGYGGDEA